jgi:hypothetical protein
MNDILEMLLEIVEAAEVLNRELDGQVLAVPVVFNAPPWWEEL